MKRLWKCIVNFFWYPSEDVAATSSDASPVKTKRVKKPKVEASTTTESPAPKKPRKKKIVEGNASLLGDAAKE